MNLKRIQAFILVVEKRSFSEAAERMGLTQPAVSQQLKALEEELGVTLLNRSSAEIEPTVSGAVLYEKGKQILAMWDETTNRIHSLQQTLSGTLRIGASTTPGSYLLPPILAKFCLNYPLITIVLEIRDSQASLKDLEDRQVDVCVVGCIPTSKEIRRQELTKDYLVCIGPKSYPLPPAKKLTLQWLIQQPLVVREKGSGTRISMEANFTEKGIRCSDLKVVAQLGSTEAIISAVEAGMGLSFISQYAAQPAISADRIQLVRIEPAIERNICLSYLKTQENNPLVSTFIQFVQHELSDDLQCESPDPPLGFPSSDLPRRG